VSIDNTRSIRDAIELATTPMVERHEPCPVACDLGTHAFTGLPSTPDELDREHAFLVGKTSGGESGFTGLSVVINVYEQITRGRTKLDTPRVAVLYQGKVDQIVDLEPSEAAQLGALLQCAAELAAEVAVAL
jgi:hypothetical protein